MGKMYVLTNGTNYVMENPHKEGDYASTTFANKAKEFTYKSAKKLLQNKKKSLAWIRSYYMLDRESGEKVSSNYYGNEGAYIGCVILEGYSLLNQHYIWL